MRRFLRYPLTPEFTKYVNAKREWGIITDTKFRILAAREGHETGISTVAFRLAYEDVLRKLPIGKTIEVYELHTHPGVWPVAHSPSDILVDVNPNNTRMKEDFISRGIKIVAYGVVSKGGIGLIRYRGETQKINESAGRLLAAKQKMYALKRAEEIIKRRGHTFNEYATDLLGKKEDEFITATAQNSTFRKAVREVPGITFRKINRRAKSGNRRKGWRY